MFTGIIEEIGYINKIVPQGAGKRFEISAQKILSDLKVDQSVSVNGVCLTVVKTGQDSFHADAVAETLKKSTLNSLKVKSAVNLERALQLKDRLGGHLVQGHVDGVGQIKRFLKEPGQTTLTVRIPDPLEKYCINKGSVAIDGVSLTIAQKNGSELTVAMIPHTLSQTIFQFSQLNDRVNIEVDFLAKYLEQFLYQKNSETKITPTWLKQHGF